MAELMTENESKSNPRTHNRVRFDIHQFTILNYASKEANVLKNVQLYDEEEKTLRTWNYLNLAFV